MKFLGSTLVTLGALASAVNAECPTNSIPGTATDAAALVCICPSGFVYTAPEPPTTVGNCDTAASYSTCTPQSLPAPDPEVTTLAVSVAAGSVAADGNDVAFKLKLPMSGTRRFKKIGFTARGTAPTLADDSNCLAGAANGFKSFTYGTVESCSDTWVITIPFGKMQACGLRISTDPTEAVAGYEVYTGNIHIEMEEDVTLGGNDAGVSAQFGVPVIRQLVTDYPIKINLDNRAVAVMDASSTAVYTGPRVDWAITGQNIKADDFTRITASIKYTTQYPYDVISFGAIEYPRVQAPATAEPITASIGTISRCTKSNFATVKTSGGVDTDSQQCERTNTLTFATGHITDEQCKFAGYQYALPFSVQCYYGMNSEDCPLQSAVTGNVATFTITSDNFCTAKSFNQNINGVITMGAFTGIKADAALTRQDAWKYGDTLLMRMQFSGLAVTDMALTSMEARFDNSEAGASSDAQTTETTVGGSWYAVGTAGSGAATSSQHLTATGDLAFVAAGNDPIQLGLVDGNEFRFKMHIGTELLNGVTSIARGDDRFLRLRAIVNVSYDTLRRRRRQAQQATGGGRQESETQTIQAADTEAAAPAPNSAVRAAPAVALVLALLSAVALL